MINFYYTLNQKKKKKYESTKLVTFYREFINGKTINTKLISFVILRKKYVVGDNDPILNRRRNFIVYYFFRILFLNFDTKTFTKYFVSYFY